jgi:hypothetical protein
MYASSSLVCAAQKNFLKEKSGIIVVILDPVPWLKRRGDIPLFPNTSENVLISLSLDALSIK